MDKRITIIIMGASLDTLSEVVVKTFDDVEMCFTTTLQPKKWVLLQSNILHNVTNITTLRTSVALRFIEK